MEPAPQPKKVVIRHPPQTAPQAAKPAPRPAPKPQIADLWESEAEAERARAEVEAQAQAELDEWCATARPKVVTRVRLVGPDLNDLIVLIPVGALLLIAAWLLAAASKTP